jgi:hypothetical protein
MNLTFIIHKQIVHFLDIFVKDLQNANANLYCHKNSLGEKNISLPATAVLLRPPRDSGGPVAKFLVTDWGDKVDCGLGLS